MDVSDHVEQQREVCRRFGVERVPSPPHLKVGIARNVRDGVLPINGLRHCPEADTTGWYIWAGEEPGTAPDFFEPLHVEHLADWCPDALRFLGLPPGWRFLVAGAYADAWEDPQLLRPDVAVVDTKCAETLGDEDLYLNQ